MVEVWAPFATRFDGPSDKHGYPGQPEPLPKVGLLMHSMEGSMSSALRELANAARRASWTFSNPKTGPLLEHYALGSHTWANGSKEANVKFDSCENEGKAGEPLTSSQVDNAVELVVWEYQQNEWTGLERHVQLWEHNEMTRFGAAPTACPSNRIPWDEIISRAEVILHEEDEEMKLVREQSSGFVFVMSGVWYSYLHQIEDATAMGVSTNIEVVPDGTLQSYVRADKWWT